MAETRSLLESSMLRKEARRERVLKNMVRNRENSAVQGETADLFSLEISKQLHESSDLIDSEIITDNKQAMVYRQQCENDELERRLNENNKRKTRLQNLREEAIQSSQMFSDTQEKWNTIMALDIPVDISKELEDQRDRCEECLRSKDHLIQQFQEALRLKDEDYVRSLKQQADNLDNLLGTIQNTDVQFADSIATERRTVTSTIEQQRSLMLESHRKEIDELLNRRRDMESKYTESLDKQERKNYYEISTLSEKGSEQYNKLKIELEVNVQTLKQQLEEIRATYQLNAEKLDYNYRVLTELDIEKTSELNRCKKQNVKVKENLAQVVRQYHSQETKDARRNDDLTEGYKRLADKYRDLQAKFRRFEEIDAERYNDLHQMHEGEVRVMVDKLLAADLAVTEQILGWKWMAPDMSLLVGNHGEDRLKVNDDDSINVLMPSTTSDSTDTIIIHEPSNLDDKTISGRALKIIMKMLLQEVGFLINPEIEEDLLKLESIEEANEGRIRQVMKITGISDQHLDLLIKRMVADGASGIQSNEEAGEDLKELEKELGVITDDDDTGDVLRKLPRSEDVIKVLKKLVIEIKSLDLSSSSSTSHKGKKKQVSDDDQRSKHDHSKGLVMWSLLSSVVASERLDSWRTAGEEMMRMNQYLKKRSTCVERLLVLRKENEELRGSVSVFLQGTTCEALLVPPTQTLHLSRE